MTATGSSLIKLQNQSCARERSIYVCGELLILGKSVLRHTQAEMTTSSSLFVPSGQPTLRGDIEARRSRLRHHKSRARGRDVVLLVSSMSWP